MQRSSLRSEHHPTPAQSRARRIGPANGRAEREADATARNVLGNNGRACACGGGCPRCETTSAPTSGRGRPLDPTTRAFFEPRFGRDLGSVRVHDDAAAARSARAMGAKAYTAGNDIVFARGRYAPDQPAGRELLAHELAHVVLHGGRVPDTIFRSEDDTQVSASEVQRLHDEMRIRATKNAWNGVNSAYEDIEALGPDPFSVAHDPAGLHFLGAEAARNLGDVLEQRTRLRRAMTALGGAEGEEAEAQRGAIEASLGNIETNFGMVDIRPRTPSRSEKKALKRGGPALVRPETPFLPDLRKAIEVAAATLAETGEFKGILPSGDYLLDGMSITVVAGTDNSFLWGE